MRVFIVSPRPTRASWSSHRQFDVAGVVDPLGRLFEILRLRPKDIRHERLRVTVVQRKPRRLHLHHQSQKNMIGRRQWRMFLPSLARMPPRLRAPGAVSKKFLEWQCSVSSSRSLIPGTLTLSLPGLKSNPSRRTNIGLRRQARMPILISVDRTHRFRRSEFSGEETSTEHRSHPLGRDHRAPWQNAEAPQTDNDL